ncbi:MAG: ferredoxin-like protein [Dehalococcoidia bacterium]|nr:ferredoxin-like protein [Dehalococcoidia bacterium]
MGGAAIHHTLRIYSRYREHFLRYYIWQAKWTRLPVVGQLVRWLANKYGETRHAAYLLTPSEALEVVALSPRVYLGPCTCREVFHNCDNPLEAEILLVKGYNPFLEGREARYRQLTVAEAKEILDAMRQRGLLSTIIKCNGDFYAICNCCVCCCVPLRLRNEFGIGRALTRASDIIGEFKAWLAHPVV